MDRQIASTRYMEMSTSRVNKVYLLPFTQDSFLEISDLNCALISTQSKATVYSLDASYFVLGYYFIEIYTL